MATAAAYDMRSAARSWQEARLGQLHVSQTLQVHGAPEDEDFADNCEREDCDGQGRREEWGASASLFDAAHEEGDHLFHRIFDSIELLLN